MDDLRIPVAFLLAVAVLNISVFHLFFYKGLVWEIWSPARWPSGNAQFSYARGMGLIPTSCYRALRNTRYRNKSVSLQPHHCAVLPRISRGQRGQPHSGLLGLGLFWQCGKEPQDKKGMCPEHCPHFCSSPGTYYFLWSIFCYCCFADIPLFQKYGLFFGCFFFLSQQRLLLWECKIL